METNMYWNPIKGNESQPLTWSAPLLESDEEISRSTSRTEEKPTKMFRELPKTHEEIPKLESKKNSSHSKKDESFQLSEDEGDEIKKEKKHKKKKKQVESDSDRRSTKKDKKEKKKHKKEKKKKVESDSEYEKKKDKKHKKHKKKQTDSENETRHKKSNSVVDSESENKIDTDVNEDEILDNDNDLNQDDNITDVVTDKDAEETQLQNKSSYLIDGITAEDKPVLQLSMRLGAKATKLKKDAEFIPFVPGQNKNINNKEEDEEQEPVSAKIEVPKTIFADKEEELVKKQPLNNKNDAKKQEAAKVLKKSLSSKTTTSTISSNESTTESEESNLKPKSNAKKTNKEESDEIELMKKQSNEKELRLKQKYHEFIKHASSKHDIKTFEILNPDVDSITRFQMEVKRIRGEIECADYVDSKFRRFILFNKILKHFITLIYPEEESVKTWLDTLQKKREAYTKQLKKIYRLSQKTYISNPRAQFFSIFVEQLTDQFAEPILTKLMSFTQSKNTKRKQYNVEKIIVEDAIAKDLKTQVDVLSKSQQNTATILEEIAYQMKELRNSSSTTHNTKTSTNINNPSPSKQQQTSINTPIPTLTKSFSSTSESSPSKEVNLNENPLFINFSISPIAKSNDANEKKTTSLPIFNLSVHPSNSFMVLKEKIKKNLQHLTNQIIQNYTLSIFYNYNVDITKTDDNLTLFDIFKVQNGGVNLLVYLIGEFIQSPKPNDATPNNGGDEEIETEIVEDEIEEPVKSVDAFGLGSTIPFVESNSEVTAELLPQYPITQNNPINNNTTNPNNILFTNNLDRQHVIANKDTTTAITNVLSLINNGDAFEEENEEESDSNDLLAEADSD